MRHLEGCSRLEGWGTCDCGEDTPPLPTPIEGDHP